MELDSESDMNRFISQKINEIERQKRNRHGANSMYL